MAVEINGKEFELKPHQTILDNEKSQPYNDTNDIAITRDESKCIGCGLCQKVCQENNGLTIPEKVEVDNCWYFRPNGKLNFADSNCTRCGQCVNACPTGCLMEKDNIPDVEKALNNSNKIVIAQIAPSVRVSLGDSFGLKSDANLEGEMIGALKQLGFDYVFDVNVGADFTTYEEAYDLKECVENNKLPMFTSCCPARVKFIEDFHPELINNLTTVRSPQQCLAVLIKTYFAKKQNIDPKNIVVVSIMPCVAKKFETRRSGEDKSGQYDVDWSLTTREFIKLLKSKNIDLSKVEKKQFDSPLGKASGAGAIYGATGGVMESAVRTFAHIMAGKIDSSTPLRIDWQEFRGMDGIKKATINIAGKEIKIAVCAGLKNAESIIAEMKKGVEYHYIEVMACPGGCVGGGGQPKPSSQVIINKRREALYKIDGEKSIRTAHDNPIIKQVYSEFLGCPGGELAQKYLHTDYDTNKVRDCEK